MIIDNMEIFVNRGRSEDITNGSSIVKQYIMQQTKDESRSLANPIKKLVSKQKNRFDLDGFNLDLTYITNQIIAMGFPADDYESLFRNSMQDVQRFFNQRHKDHYKIINLCSERKYDHSNFNGMVSEYPFDDHQAPNFALIYGMCDDLDKWLNKDPLNVAGIHCKAGKGRTGIMICCYLLYCRLFKNSYEAMKYYGYMRTKNHKGVTIPSQIRYVFYFEKALNNNLSLQDIPQTQLYLHRLRLVTIPKADKLWIQVWCNDEITTFEDSTKQDDFIDFRLLNTKVSGDVRVMCFSKSLMTKKKKVFQFWFNTAFVQELLIIDKPMLDGAVKDKKNKIFSNNFRIELTSI